MSKIQPKDVANWESIEQAYSIELVEKALASYRRNKEYHAKRNARLAAEREEWKAMKASGKF